MLCVRKECINWLKCFKNGWMVGGDDDMPIIPRHITTYLTTSISAGSEYNHLISIGIQHVLL